MSSIEVAPSLLAADFASLTRQIDAVAAAGAETLHLDVMDGHFVPNISFGPPLLTALRPHTSMFFDVHLMVETPEDYLGDFVDAGADRLTVHAEVCPHLHRTVTRIGQLGAEAGVAVNPATPVDSLEHVLDAVDLALVMTVNPGYSGQAFIGQMLAKIRQLAQLRRQVVGDDSAAAARIQVDGGIDSDTAPAAVSAGAEVLVAGSAVFGAADPGAAFQELCRLARRTADMG